MTKDRQVNISIGQTPLKDKVAYCYMCKTHIRAYYVFKDGKPVLAVCPKKHHDKPCEITKPLEW